MLFAKNERLKSRCPMYKQFKKSLETASAETDRLLTRSYTNLSVASLKHDQINEISEEPEMDDVDDVNGSQPDPETLALVQECWEQVDTQCIEYGREQKYRKCTDDGEWKAVRIFVSSTFTDFFCEREVLVKKVFPELRDWCRRRRLHVIDCDMRWGVPKDTTTADTIAACLEELDRCLEETGGEPFFLNLVGERYGWIPAVADIPEELRTKYSWVPNTSITFMEVLHGAYRMRNPNALFMLRDSEIIKDIHEGHITRFKDTDQLSVLQLKQLKTWLLARFPDQTFDYACEVEGLIAKHGRDYVNITHLERFSDQVLEFFKTAIERFYPNRQEGISQDSSVLMENAAQKLMMEEAASALIGREREAAQLLGFVMGNTDDLQNGETSNPFSRDPAFWAELMTGSQLLALQGGQGYGKTTLMAWVAQQALKTGVRVFYHFCGGTRYSHAALVLLQRLVAFLKNDYSTEHLNSLLEKGEMELQDILREELLNLPTISKGDNPQYVIILDALDQLDSNNTVTHLHWLPPCFPASIRCLVSTSSGHPPTVSRVREHPHLELTLDNLAKDDAQQIMQVFLNKFNKKLDHDQMLPILESVCSHSPLWLYLICEELRVYGDFRTLTKHIESVTASPELMLATILKRLIEDDDTGYMAKTLGIVACQYSVMTSEDIQRMLGDVVNKEALPLLTWSKIRRSLQAFLRITNYNDQVLLAHNSMKQAVYDLVITSLAERMKYLVLFADYIELWSDDLQLRTKDLPYFLNQAQLKDRLVRFVREMPESKHIPTFMRSKWLQNCRCHSLADPVIPQVAPVLICTFCKMSRAKYFPNGFHRNEDMCVVCGNHAFPAQLAAAAHLCAFHGSKFKFGPPTCYLCGKIGDKKTMVSGKLCTHCGFGNYGKQCAALKLQ